MQRQISILTPVKNVEKWILETAESIQNQSLENWEWIIVDDFSTDDTFSILEKLAREDIRIKVYHNKEKGIIPALKLAFLHAEGKYITRMDGDDIMPENRLLNFYQAAENTQYEAVITGKVHYFSENNVSEGYQKYENWLNGLVEKNTHYEHLYRECIVASPNWMMSREKAKEIALFNQLKYPEDYDMCFHWKENKLPIIGLNEVTLLWREHPQRTSRNSETYQQEAFFKLKLNWFLKENKSKRIGVLGYGTKGKLATQILTQSNTEVCIYVQNTQTLVSDGLKTFKKAENIDSDILLIAIYPPQLSELEEILAKQNYVIGENAFYL